MLLRALRAHPHPYPSPRGRGNKKRALTPAPLLEGEGIKKHLLRRKGRESGLTLLEMLVVLLIAGMALALGFQSLMQWRRANVAISQAGGGIQQVQLTQRWLESSLRSFIALDDRPFKGAASQLEGMATQPVQWQQGGASWVRWSVERDDSGVFLHLVEDGKALDLPLPGVAAARFGYLDEAGRLHGQWPPALGLHEQLPVLMLLQQEMDDGRLRLWAGAVAGARNPRYHPFEVERD